MSEPRVGFCRTGTPVVCDGLGGHAAGEIAATLAGRTIIAALRAGVAQMRAARLRAPALSEELLPLLQAAAERAAVAVVSASRSAGREGMGCAMTALLVREGRGAFVHVGDTRLYRLRGGVLEQLTSDHTVAAELCRLGALAADRVRTHPMAHALPRCVSALEAVSFDGMAFEVAAGDRFLLCSDGLSDYVPEGSELAKLMAETDPASVPARLVQLANARGGRDNVTAILVTACDDGLPVLPGVGQAMELAEVG